MKTSLYFSLLVFLTSLQVQQAYAQKVISDQAQNTFQAAIWQVGLKEGYSQGDLLKNRNSLQLCTSYFLINQLAVGLNATWSKEWVSDFNYHDLSAGPYLRYQFTTTWLSPFIEASYQIGQRSSGSSSSISYPTVSMQSTQISPGISLGFLKFLRLDLSYGLQWVYFSRNTQSFGQPQVGLNYSFK